MNFYCLCKFKYLTVSKLKYCPSIHLQTCIPSTHILEQCINNAQDYFLHTSIILPSYHPVIR
jgi:hypothetical protein